MSSNHLLPSLRGALALAVTLTTTLSAAAGIRAAASTPPAFPDQAHVSNGCHVSSVTYLARLQAEYPAEHGEPLVIQMLNADGIRRHHTIALLTWQGQLWCRDEYFGVFALNCSVADRPGPTRLVALAQRLLEKHAQMLIRTTGMTLRPAPPESMSALQRTMEVRVIAQTIPFPATVYWVKSGKENVPLLFFRPAKGQVAVYDPQHGTCLAECPAPNDARIVAAFAAELGYQPDQIHADLGDARGTLVAANFAQIGGAR